MRRVKQILIIRKDLKMRRGKEIAQSAHASLGAVLSVMKSPKLFMGFLRLLFIRKGSPLQIWLDGPFTKVCVCVNSEQELNDLETKAKEAGLIHCLITDSGKTEFHGVPTKTVLAIGPAYESDLDKITRHLPLY